MEPYFLTLDDVMFIHEQEILAAGGANGVRIEDGVMDCVEAPKASFGGEYLYSLFGMATSYITCLTMRHPFIDGNKRTALASALSFLYMNGYSIEESYDEELADLVLDFVTQKISKEDIEQHLKQYAIKL